MTVSRRALERFGFHGLASACLSSVLACVIANCWTLRCNAGIESAILEELDSKSLTTSEESDPIKIDVELSAEKTWIAQPIEMRWVVRAPEGTVVEFPPKSKSLGNWEVLDVRDVNDIPNGKSRLWTRVWTIETWMVGPQVIPSVEISYRTKNESGMIASPSKTIEVQSSVSESAKLEAFRDLPEALPFDVVEPKPSNRVWWISISSGLILGALALAWQRWRSSRTTSPLAWAIRELESLPTRDPSSDGELFATKLSSTLRTYLQMRFHFLAPQQTSEECLKELREQSLLPQEISNRFQRIFELADRAKFAGLNLSSESMNQEIIQAVDLIRQTDPVEKTVGESKP